ncbi:DUF1433 domain-containing protein [Listeria ivanovii]|uniref:DUF1433 domain-containing protein n=1 Tax=Listeria ivanovii TaxID=1638 RepID=UPI001943C0B6|nr:DUF1433 domain-containing protein [Listeria ivanovii]MBM5607812.1 DUF1433 domain-containing protein [Listeria ivanovii]MBM5636173.1 DUF1433 domain-containing protein [Listeria ivanovii]MBM5705356.1 DUF1433 domain-containing protein [Listeria ivanovii]
MKHQEKELMQEQKPRIEKFLHYNFNNINNITLTTTYINPTGVTHIEGYVNDDKTLTIDAPVDKNGVEIVNGTGSNRLYDDYLKKEFQEKAKNVTDIEREEKAKKKKEKESNTEKSSLKVRSVQEIMTDLQSLEASILQNNRHPL